MNETSPTQTALPHAALSEAAQTDPAAIATVGRDGLARRGERELGLSRALHGSRDDTALRMPSHGEDAPSLGGGLSAEEQALLLAAFGIDARTRPLSLLAVDFIRTRRRLRDARPRIVDATC